MEGDLLESGEQHKIITNMSADKGLWFGQGNYNPVRVEENLTSKME